MTAPGVRTTTHFSRLPETADVSDRYAVNVEGAIYRDGRYLLIRRSEAEDHAAGEWSIVGGTVEGMPDGDDALFATLRREVREEVGVRIEDPRYVTSGTFVDDGDTPVVNVVCLCAHGSGKPSVRDPEEVAEVAWVPAAELFDRELPPYVESHLREVDALRRSLGW